MENTTELSSESDDVRVLRKSFEYCEATAESGIRDATDIINQLRWALELMPDLSWEDTFANDLGTRLCFARAYRQLRSCVTLTFHGYYSEIGVLLRAVYEAASLGRMLAKEPELAERWLKKRKWFPEKQVREWMRSKKYLQFSDAQLADYDAIYCQMSAAAHPTIQSCVLLASLGEESCTLKLDSDFSTDKFSQSIKEIACAGLFCCFALKNAAVDPANIHPDWHRQLSELAPRITGQETPHLNQDWEKIENDFVKLRKRVREAAELRDHLKYYPLSWENLKGPTD